jgi:hypothetical protein
MAPEPGTPENENENPDLSAQKEQRAWDAIVADLSGTIDIGDLTPTPDPFIDELLAEEGDYEPPHPPPLKAPTDAVGRFAWAGGLGGPDFVVVTYVMDLGGWLGAVGVFASGAGFVTLIARMPHERDSDDDGAVV